VTWRWMAVTAATAARGAVAERGALVVTAGFYVIVLVTISALWRSAAEVNGGFVAGYGGGALAWYLATSEAATVGLRLRLIEHIGDDIADGSVAAEMLRPASVVGVRLAAEIGRSLPRVGMCAAVGVVVATVVGGGPPDGAALLLAVPALVLAVVANLAAQHAFAAAAFWVRDARSTWFLYQKVYFILGGMLLPLEVLPGRVQAVARALPFMAMAYAPARLASGHPEPVLLAVQAAWAVALVAGAVVAFRAGERRLQAVGG
jgi:ABC-2 type transport system permease protein